MDVRIAEHTEGIQFVCKNKMRETHKCERSKWTGNKLWGVTGKLATWLGRKKGAKNLILQINHMISATQNILVLEICIIMVLLRLPNCYSAV